MRTIFSPEEVATLSRHPCVFACTATSVSYTVEFKKNALELHAHGVTAREIWKRAGFDTHKWKGPYFKGTLNDWKKIVRKRGVEGLFRVGGRQYDRGPVATEKDKVRRLELQVTYLKAENDFLAHLRARRAESNSGRVKSTGSSER